MASGGGDSCKAKTLELALEQPTSDSESQSQDEEEKEEEEPTFLDQPPVRYYCLICHSVMRDPHIVMCCCKKMCGACIERVHHSGQLCPNCRKPDFVMYPERDLNSEILDLKVRCTHHTNGCEWVGELRDLKKHTGPEKGSCGFIPVKCPYGCPVAYLRHESDNHESVCTNLPPELQIKRTMRATDQFKEELQVTLDRFQELYKSESEHVRELTNQLETMKENRKKEEQEMKHQFEVEKKQLLDKCHSEYQQQIKLLTESLREEFAQEMSKMKKSEGDNQQQMASLKQRFEKEEKERSEAAKKQLSELKEYYQKELKKNEGENDFSSSQAEAESPHTVCVLVSNVPLGYDPYDVTKCLQDAATPTTTISDARVVPTQKPGNATPHSVNHAIITVNTSDTKGIPESLKFEEGIPAADPLVIPMFQEKAAVSFKIPTPIKEKVVLQNIQSQGKELSLQIEINSDSIKVRGSCSQVFKFREYLVKHLTEYHLNLPQHEVSQPSTLIPQENSQPHEHSTPHPPTDSTEGAAAGYSPEESKVFTGLSKDVLLLMSKVGEGRFKMMNLKFFPEEGKVVVLATSEEEQEKCISQFQETYQDIIKNRYLKSGNLEIPANLPVEEMFSLLDEFNDKYNQCHFSCDEKARVIRIVSMSSRQFDQAKRLISDRLTGEKGGGTAGKGAARKIPTKMGSSEVLVISEGRKLTVKRGNIVDEDVDAIVNAANERLDHGLGVAGALNKASGGVLQAVSNDYIKAYGKVPVGGAALTKAGGGKLRCKRVIHAVSPIASQCKSDMMCSALIFKAIASSLIEAQKIKVATVAFPALSTGIYAVNRHLAADAIFEAMLKFHYTSNDVLKDIRIVILDEETYTVFTQHLLAIKAKGSSAAQNTGTSVLRYF